MSLFTSELVSSMCNDVNLLWMGDPADNKEALMRPAKCEFKVGSGTPSRFSIVYDKIFSLKVDGSKEVFMRFAHEDYSMERPLIKGALTILRDRFPNDQTLGNKAQSVLDLYDKKKSKPRKHRKSQTGRNENEIKGTKSSSQVQTAAPLVDSRTTCTSSTAAPATKGVESKTKTAGGPSPKSRRRTRSQNRSANKLPKQIHWNQQRKQKVDELARAGKLKKSEKRKEKENAREAAEKSAIKAQLDTKIERMEKRQQAEKRKEKEIARKQEEYKRRKEALKEQQERQETAEKLKQQEIRKALRQRRVRKPKEVKPDADEIYDLKSLKKGPRVRFGNDPHFISDKVTIKKFDAKDENKPIGNKPSTKNGKPAKGRKATKTKMLIIVEENTVGRLENVREIDVGCPTWFDCTFSKGCQFNPKDQPIITYTLKLKRNDDDARKGIPHQTVTVRYRATKKGDTEYLRDATKFAEDCQITSGLNRNRNQSDLFIKCVLKTLRTKNYRPMYVLSLGKKRYANHHRKAQTVAKRYGRRDPQE